MTALADIQAKKLKIKKALRDALETLALAIDNGEESAVIGTLASLTTTAKTNLVAAINELDGEHGVLSTLTTTAKNTFVAAVNELVTAIGTLASLNTTAKTNLVGALNEVLAEVDLNTGKVGAEATPVDGVKATVTVDMTNANADLTYTAKAYGTDGNSITVTHVDPSGNNKVLAVTVSGKDITVSLATDGSGNITSTANEVKAAVDAHAEASALVAVTVEGTGAGVTNAEAKATLTGGVNVTAGEIGSLRFDDTNFYMKISAQVWKKVAHSAL